MIIHIYIYIYVYVSRVYVQAPRTGLSIAGLLRTFSREVFLSRCLRSVLIILSRKKYIGGSQEINAYPNTSSYVLNHS